MTKIQDKCFKCWKGHGVLDTPKCVGKGIY